MSEKKVLESEKEKTNRVKRENNAITAKETRRVPEQWP